MSPSGWHVFCSAARETVLLFFLRVNLYLALTCIYLLCSVYFRMLERQSDIERDRDINLSSAASGQAGSSGSLTWMLEAQALDLPSSMCGCWELDCMQRRELSTSSPILDAVS